MTTKLWVFPMKHSVKATYTLKTRTAHSEPQPCMYSDLLLSFYFVHPSFIPSYIPVAAGSHPDTANLDHLAGPPGPRTWSASSVR